MWQLHDLLILAPGAGSFSEGLASMVPSLGCSYL
jgi:hypothetical protein